MVPAGDEVIFVFGFRFGMPKQKTEKSFALHRIIGLPGFF
jgi:hypothetical protein